MNKVLLAGIAALIASKFMSSKEDGEYLYHWTPTKNVPRIRKIGLLMGDGCASSVEECQGKVFFSKNAEVWGAYYGEEFPKTKFSQLRAKTDDLKKCERAWSNIGPYLVEDCFVRHRVTPRFLEIMVRGVWKKLS